MAKAITIVLLLTATAAFAAAHPGLGKGGILSNIVVGNGPTGTPAPPNNRTDAGASTAKSIVVGAQADGAAGSTRNFTGAGAGISKSITINKDGGDILGGIHGGNSCDLGHKNCQWTKECKNNTSQVCEERTKVEKVCKNDTTSEQVVKCEKKCFKADKIITIGHAGKGRRLLSADSINIVPHMHSGIAHAVINKDNNGTNGGQQEVCREICRPETKTTTVEKCSPESKTEQVCTPKVVTECRRICECNIDIGKIIGKGH